MAVVVLSITASLPIHAQVNDIQPTDSAEVATININEANKSELTKLKGIGEKRALAIIAYREQVGPIHSAQQLLSIKGIGEKVLIDNKSVLSF